MNWSLNQRRIAAGLNIAFAGFLTAAIILVPAQNVEASEVMSVGFSHYLVIDAKGELYAWGDCYTGDSGNGYSAPTKIDARNNWTSVSAGSGFSLALNSENELFSWGGNRWGELGNNSYSPSSKPAQIGSWISWAEVSAGGSHSLGISTDGKLYAWGENDDRQLGDGTTSRVFAPKQIGGRSDWTSVSAGNWHSLAITDSGELYAWGDNTNGKLGIGSSDFASTPTRIGSESDWVMVSAGLGHTLAINNRGELYAWGQNIDGQLGIGSQEAFCSEPVKVGSAANWRYVSAGAINSYAIDASGQLYAWGNASQGMLGNGTSGTAFSSNVPIRIGVGTVWSEVSAGWMNSFALSSQDQLYAWGWRGLHDLLEGFQGLATAPLRVSGFRIDTQEELCIVSFEPGHSLPPFQVLKGTVIGANLPILKSDGSKFLGWTVEGSDSLLKPSTVVNSHIELCPIWEAYTPDISFSQPDNSSNQPSNSSSQKMPLGTTSEKICVVSFNSKGGAKVERKSVTVNSRIGALPKPKRTGYAFRGWYDSAGKKVHSDTRIVSDMRLVARWSSSNANLKSLKISKGKLNRKFSKKSANYVLKLSKSQGSVRLTPAVEDKGASIWIKDGSRRSEFVKSKNVVVKVKPGKSQTVQIRVVSQSGFGLKTYKVKVVRGK